MTDIQNKGRVTIPTDVDVVPETLELLKRWGAEDRKTTPGPRPTQTRSSSATL